jgi:hypothetical protein
MDDLVRAFLATEVVHHEVGSRLPERDRGPELAPVHQCLLADQNLKDRTRGGLAEGGFGGKRSSSLTSFPAAAKLLRKRRRKDGMARRPEASHPSGRLTRIPDRPASNRAMTCAEGGSAIAAGETTK